MLSRFSSFIILVIGFSVVVTAFAQLPTISFWKKPAASALHGGGHTAAQCAAASGTVVSIGGGDSLCQMSGASCAGGWTRLANWGTTSAGSCSNCTSCTTASHATFANTALETCAFAAMSPFMVCNIPVTCQATLTSVGCY